MQKIAGMPILLAITMSGIAVESPLYLRIKMRLQKKPGVLQYARRWITVHKINALIGCFQLLFSFTELLPNNP
ncbi:hypothetical protein J4E06_00055 [Muricauda sp. NFXS6]|uniref:hypothetical protein n=1 Tax=Allomuricauda sp. NFXS6 TaxID=2819094 RepID=UPI0032DE8F28